MDKQIKDKLSSTEINKIEVDKAVKVSDMEFKEKKLQNIPEKVKKQQSHLYWAINSICYDILPYRSSALKDFENSFASLVTKNKGTLLTCVKQKVIQKEIEKLPQGSRSNVRIKRNFASRFVDTGKCDHTGEYTIFG